MVHTAVWAVFASAILAIPVAVSLGRRELAFNLIAVVSIECLVLAFNGLRCPLTDIAAHYTDDRRPNFDIYLPAWLARHNKTIFGTLFAGALVFTAISWMMGLFTAPLSSRAP